MNVRARCGCIGTLAAAALTFASCATPERAVDRLAAEHGFGRDVVRGTRFDHLLYRNAAVAGAGPLHVYIEGDGSPYLASGAVAPDPTPRTPVMLRLLALDAAPSVYVGRPCYFGLQSGCSPVFWTVGRFNVDVVESMAAVVARLAAERDGQGLVLLGHSGGAALAVLLAQRLPNVRAVVTVGGNLDTSAWTELHGYAPLGLSSNPSERPLTGVPLVVHLVGAADDVTPPAFVAAAARKLGTGDVRIVAGAGHTCCFEQLWPALLAELP
jgi:pimeloyl-ACP methyl ester carboxylesterase